MTPEILFRTSSTSSPAFTKQKTYTHPNPTPRESYSCLDKLSDTNQIFDLVFVSRYAIYQIGPCYIKGVLQMVVTAKRGFIC